MNNQTLTNKRLISLDDAADYLSRIDGAPVFETDIIQLICDGEIQPFCRISGLWGRESWPDCKTELPEGSTSEESTAVLYSQISYTETEEVVIGLDGEKASKPRSHNHRATDEELLTFLRISRMKHKQPYTILRTLPLEKEGEKVWLQGIFRIHVGNELIGWLMALINKEPLFDVQNFLLLDKDGNRYRIYSRAYDSLYEYFCSGRPLLPAWVRLKKSNIVIDVEQLNQVYKKSKSEKISRESGPAGKLSLRMKVASFYIASVTKEHVLATPTHGLWDELRKAAEELSQNDGSIEPEILFSQHLKENTILTEFGKFRKHGLDFPLRR